MNDSAQATNGGSWGSSRGGFASTGGVVIVRRTPVRNLLGRLSSHHRIGYGSSGGSWGSSGGWYHGGLLGRRTLGSTGGWSGSSGGWYASSGSTGSYASTGSFASTGSIVTTTYAVPAMGIETSPTQCETPIADGGPIDSMLDGAASSEDGNFQPVPDEKYYEGAKPIEGAVPDKAGDGKAVEPPGPVEDDTTSTTRPKTDSSVLNIVLPSEAQVYINDKLTTTQGSRRSYQSRNLELGKEYKYQVKAVVIRGGKQLVRTRVVTMIPGIDETVQFDFDAVAETDELPAPLTTLALEVPANATVTLCGNKTNRSGSYRTFSTKSLKPGKVWKDYHVLVEFERDGKPVSEQRSLDMVAGETYTLTFGVDASTHDSVASK